MKTQIIFTLLLIFSTQVFAAEKTVSGIVQWGSKLTSEQKKLPSTAVLYIFAKKMNGQTTPPMPIAVKRIPFPFQLPKDFTLSASDSMVAGTPFTGPMQITARISKSGSVMPVQPGDIEGSTLKPVELGASGIQIELTNVK